jgi:hypothetical protein
MYNICILERKRKKKKKHLNSRIVIHASESLFEDSLALYIELERGGEEKYFSARE